MIFKFTKYRKSYAAVILASYLLLVSISILHYHNIDIQTGNYNVTTNSQSSSRDAFDTLDDITHECTIQHFTNTIINYNFITVFDVIKETSEQNISFTGKLILPQSPSYNSNQLRAPPLFS
jgi:hypothetical protein